MPRSPFNLRLYATVDAASKVKIENTLLELRLRLLDFSAPLQKCADIMHESIKKNFNQQGRPNKWKPLAPLTLTNRLAKNKDSRVNKGKSSLILFATGALYKAASSPHLSPDKRFKVTRFTLMMGVSNPYAKAQQEGRGPMIIEPRRKKALKFIGVGKRAMKASELIPKSEVKGKTEAYRAMQATVARGEKVIGTGEDTMLKYYGGHFFQKVKHPGIPPRPFLLIQPEDLKTITHIFENYIMGRM